MTARTSVQSDSVVVIFAVVHLQEPKDCPPDVWSQLQSLVEGDAPVESWLQGGARAWCTAWRYICAYNLGYIPIVVWLIGIWLAWTRGLISKIELLMLTAYVMCSIAPIAISEAIRFVNKWYERGR